MIILMQCLNEENYVDRCIGDFHDEEWVDKIIVIDGGSTDYTVQELLKYPKVSVHVHPWIDSYHAMNAMQRNIGLSYVQEGEILFMLDFDERLTNPLKLRLKQIKETDFDLVHVPRRTIEVLRYPDSPFAMIGEDGWPIESHQIGQFPDPQPRLINKRLGMCWVNSPHHVLLGCEKSLPYNGVFAVDEHILHYEKDDARHRFRIERKWAREQAARKELGIKHDVFETRLKPEVAQYGEPNKWK